jgi:hypothetical protein
MPPSSSDSSSTRSVCVHCTTNVCFLNGRLSQQYRVVVVLPFRDAMVKFSKGLPQSFKHTTTRQIASADESVTSDARALQPPTSPPLYSYVIGRYPTQHLKYTDNEAHTSTHGRRRQGPVRIAVSDPRVVRPNG